ncbi:lamin tail domain-containing protein [Niallia taxi]|uniref:lamin tail domain-containing protein n=1 Tax=Niallia taxi TaxID=2499688 RepID=UPI0015F5A5DD|nr:lamin tail domain-containing protein [Niallia taxi]
MISRKGRKTSKKWMLLVLMVVFFFSTIFTSSRPSVSYAAQPLDPQQAPSASDGESETANSSNETVEKEQTLPASDSPEETKETQPPEQTETKEEDKSSSTDLKEETKTQSQTEEEAKQPEQPEQPEQPAEESQQEEEKKEQQQETAEEDFSKYPQLLITEISPDSKGTDLYEYVEVYNNTNQTLNLASYAFYYQYTDKSQADKLLQLPDTSVASGQTQVIWFNKDELGISDFNKHFQTSLSDSQVTSFKGDFSGFANGGNRAVVIKSLAGNEIISANYMPGETDNTGLTVAYRYPASGTIMDKLQIKAAPTPGSILDDQVPAKQVEIDAPVVDNEAPQISHSPIKSSKHAVSIKIEATITDNAKIPSATLHYKQEGNDTYQSVLMSKNSSSNTGFSAVIPEEAVVKNIHYYLEATDGSTTAKTEEYVIEVDKQEDTYSSIPLLVTELAPNSQGGGTDYYEYIELYNNSNQPLPLTNYSFAYRYTDGSREDVNFKVPDAVIKPQTTVVLWFNNGAKPLADFNSQFGTSLTEDSLLSFTDAFPGFANGGNRAVVIKDRSGNELVSASYLGTENNNDGKVIQYQFPKSGTVMAKLEVLADPTPGSLKQGQVPTKPAVLPEQTEDTKAPAISHKAVSNGEAFADIAVEAVVTDDKADPFATLYYKSESTEDYISLSMTEDKKEKGKFKAIIPAEDVDSNLTYYIEASDGVNKAETDKYTVAIKKADVDYAKVPKLFVTELVPDSSNVNSADGYEFIEVYNNTNKPVNFKDYKIQYRYGADPASDVVWPSIPEDVVIPAKGILVFWIINSANGDKTVADFNANYGTSLVENKDIVRIQSDGMANSGLRGVAIATNTQEELNVAYYNDVLEVDDTVANKGILYKYPQDGSTTSIKISSGEKQGTPGSVEANQVPGKSVQVEEDTTPPTIENTTILKETGIEDITVSAKANDNNGVKTVAVYYRTNGEQKYERLLLKKDGNDNLYTTTIYAANFIAKEYVEYYLTASDGINEVKTENHKIKINNPENTEELRINVKDGSTVSGNVLLKGTSNSHDAKKVKLFIDGKELSAAMNPSLETQAYLAVDISGLNMYFKNAITMGDEIIQLLDKDNMSYWKTFTIPIDADKLKQGINEITVRAGNKSSPFQLEESEENRDDYSLRNVRLILADGTIIRDPEKSDPAKIYDMGDDGTYRPFEHFHFTLTSEQTSAAAYNWDSKTVSDGKHTISAKDGQNEASVSVMVDNTAPVIDTNMKKQEYRGAFTINATASDELAGMESFQAMLDDEVIEVPYETASSKLSPGEHVLTITATDKAGNIANRQVSFTVNDENPTKPELVSPADIADGIKGNPLLKVKVADPTNDKLNVTFYKGFKYSAKSSNVTAYKHASDTEPPTEQKPAGEAALTEEEINTVSSLDGKYLTTDSDTQFPYHRFDVELDPSVGENDRVELAWSGKSLEGRKVSMYAWSFSENKWKMLTYKIAGNADFELKADASVKEFAKDSKISVIIQDEIPSTPDGYDYTFVWMSDTQYYSESYPYIFKRQTEWIAEMKEQMKIKYVFHTGDLVDESDKVQQWQYADEYMQVLDDNNIPYGVLAGNHDVDQLSNDYNEYYKWFGADRFSSKSYYGNSYKNNRGHYDLISAGGNDFIMLYMGWGVDDEDIAWMNNVLKQYPNRKAILNFHEYLLVSGNRSPIGDKIYEEVVKPNKNVLAVLSGHYHDSETLISEVDDNGDGTADREVYQMLGDYQGGPEGGQGYLKLLHFDQDNNRIIVNTYSPYLDDYNFYDPAEYPGKDELIINMDLEAEKKRVATDYFAVNVYTDDEIGKQENIESGKTAEIEWQGLEEGNEYAWYAVATDDYTGSAVSDIWTFIKGAKEDDTETPTDPSDGDNGETPGETDPSDGDNGETPGDTDPSDGDNGEAPGDTDPSDGDNGETPGDTDPSDGDNGEIPGDTDPSDGDNGETPGDTDPTDGDNEETPGDTDPNDGDSEEKPVASHPSDNNGNIPGRTNTDNNSGDDKRNPSGQKGSNVQLVSVSANNNSGNDSVLPDTATDYYNLLIIGAVLAAAGISIYAIIRRRAKLVQNR